jgi:hypothetical protein
MYRSLINTCFFFCKPVPLQCSENVGENPRDITPETCNSVKVGHISTHQSYIKTSCITATNINTR